MHTESPAIRGLRYHVRLWGPADAPPVLLLHGLLDTGASFAPLAGQLDERWRLIAPDWRGHGDSDYAPAGYWFPDYVADLDALVSHYAAEQPVRIVAHSMGGTAAALFAGLRPQAVSHLVCLDSLNVPDNAPERVPERYRGWLDAQRRPPPPKTYPDRAALAARIRKRYPELADERITRLARDWSRATADGRIRLANDPRHRVPFPHGFHAADNMAVWRQVQAHVFCLDGAESPASQWISDAEMETRRACFADVSHERLPGCGHMLHLEQPEAVGARITAFFDAATAAG